MPEGPEVKLSADLIRPMIVGKTIMNAWPTAEGRYAATEPEGYIPFWKDQNRGCQVASIDVKGKFMYWLFTNGWYLMNTFGMTGQWSQTAGKHPCFIFQYLAGIDEEGLADSYHMVFNDPRHFGTIKFTNRSQDIEDKLSSLGWDPLQEKLEDHIHSLTWLIRRSNKPIGQLLMDQKKFAGVGNYIRAEGLYKAKISPWRLGRQLSEQEVKNLCQAISRVMHDSYDHQGATIHTYKTAYGEEGKYSSCFKVYGQKKDPSGNHIVKEDTPDGRTIHWCPAIQK